MYEHAGRRPYCSINFITSHDGYTLNDLVTYKDKHNEANGEGNRDGENNNISDNYGVEGPTRRKVIRQLRVRQIKNMLATLMLSQGVPMIVAGDECRRTQTGNNNAYCQDNDMSWFDWRLVKRNASLVRFVQTLIHFRRDQATVRRRRFLSGDPRDDGSPDVMWFNADGVPTHDWSNGEMTLMCLLNSPPAAEDPDGAGRDLLLMFNATGGRENFVVPDVVRDRHWRLFVDTAGAPPRDIYPDLDGPAPPAKRPVTLNYRAMRCYVAL